MIAIARLNHPSRGVFLLLSFASGVSPGVVTCSNVHRLDLLHA